MFLWKRYFWDMLNGINYRFLILSGFISWVTLCIWAPNDSEYYYRQRHAELDYEFVENEAAETLTNFSINQLNLGMWIGVFFVLTFIGVFVVFHIISDQIKRFLHMINNGRLNIDKLNAENAELNMENNNLNNENAHLMDKIESCKKQNQLLQSFCDRLIKNRDPTRCDMGTQYDFEISPSVIHIVATDDLEQIKANCTQLIIHHYPKNYENFH